MDLADVKGFFGRRAVRVASWTLVTALAYYVVERVSMQFMLPGTWIAVIWPANGVAVGIGILVGPWVAVGAFLADVVFESTAFGSLSAGGAAALGNALQVFVLAWAVRRYLGGRHALQTPGGVVRYALYVGVLGTCISATVGVTAFLLQGVVTAEDYFSSWLVWWTSDVVALLLVTPVFLVWAHGRDQGEGGPVEKVLFGSAAAAVVLAVHVLPVEAFGFGFAMVSLPLVCWAAFRFGSRAVALTTLAVATAAVGHLLIDAQDGSAGHRELLYMQTFVALASVTGLVLAANVVQERARMAEAAKREFAAVNDARNRLLSTFAHELNNPLTPMLVQLDLMTSGETGPLDPEQVKALRLIERSTLRLSKLVSDLRDVGHLQAGHGLRLRLGDVDLSEVASDVVESYRSAASALGIGFELDVEGPVEVVGDADRLSQVLSNIVGNALKYTPSGGMVRVRVSGRGDGGVVEVGDDGPGMTAAQIEHLFTPFGQVQTRDRQKEGTGLGLYIARGIVVSHGGSIQCTSEGPGRGSVFVVKLPLRRVSQPLAGPHPAPTGLVPS